MQSQCIHVHMHQHTCEHISISTQFMCTLTPIYSQQHTHIQTWKHTFRHMHTCAHQHTHWPTHTHTWAAKHWQNILHSLHLHAYTHTHKYIHIPSHITIRDALLSPHPVPSLKKGQGLPDGWDGQARPLPLAYPDPNCPGQL